MFISALRSMFSTPCGARRPVLGFAAAVLLGVLALSGCSDKKVITPPPPISVNMIKITPRDEMLWIETLGTTEGETQADVRAQVSGTLMAINYKEGDKVQAGQTLFVIDDAPFKAKLDAARAERLRAHASWQQARREARRYEKLFAVRAASSKDRDDAVSAEQVAQASFLAAQAAEANARIDLEHTRVKAVTSGHVSRAEVNIGALVSATSTRLALITQPDALRVAFQVSERDLAGANISTQNLARIVLPDGKRINVQLDYVDAGLQSTSATRSLRARIPTQTKLLPGQFVHVQLQTAQLHGVYRVPQSAVLQRPDGSYQVYVMENGKAMARTVTVGQWKDTDWIILSGLKAGDAVIVNQLQRLRNGRAVKLADTTNKK